MKKGEILIAETTSPDVIAACNKASAIVTNQGGILSHAAIVSCLVACVPATHAWCWAASFGKFVATFKSGIEIFFL